MEKIKRVRIKRLKGVTAEDMTDVVIVEKLINLYVNGRHFSSLMYTPGDEEELITGFLFSQALIKARSDIRSLEFRGEDIAMITLTGEAVDNFADIMALTSGCAGGSTKLSFLESGRNNIVESSYSTAAEVIIKNMRQFNSFSALFRETGGVHGCALYSGENLLFMREDIGRHNAADKVIGAGLVNIADFGDKMLFTTGRVSSDIVIKTSAAGIPILVSHSAPTDTAIKLAEASNLTLAGFVRGDRMNIYCGCSRISY